MRQYKINKYNRKRTQMINKLLYGFLLSPIAITNEEKTVKEKIKESLILSGYYFVEVIERVIKSGT